MSLLPQTLLNATSNEHQTLEIHSEILEPLSHSQRITRWEIPHKNILDSDSVLIWKVYWDSQLDFKTDTNMVCLPPLDAGLYTTIKRARLFVNGKVISELNEVGKYLTLKNNFTPHEVKTEVNDFFSYANHELQNNGGLCDFKVARVQRTPGDKELGSQVGAVGNRFEVECSLKLHQLFAILKDAQLDTNNIEGKIMIEVDWDEKNQNTATDNMLYCGGAIANGKKAVKVEDPRLILDFLTYNAEAQAQIKASIWGDGGGINMPFREVALVRKTINAGASAGVSQDLSMGMTGRAVQKIWVAKVMDNNGNDVNTLNCDNRSDLLSGQKWNVRVNDLMIYDRDVDNRAEEFNYLQQTGEKQYTCAPGVFESRKNGVAEGQHRVANDNQWVDTTNLVYANATATNTQGKGNTDNCPAGDLTGGRVGQGVRNNTGLVKVGAPVQGANIVAQTLGRQNYLGINLAKYSNGAESPLNAMRVGSTPIVFNLGYDQNNDANTTARGGVIYFWVEYLKMMNLSKGQISVMDL